MNNIIRLNTEALTAIKKETINNIRKKVNIDSKYVFSSDEITIVLKLRACSERHIRARNEVK